VPYGKAITIPIHELDHVLSFIAENKQGTGQGIGIQFRTNETGKAIKGFSHITWCAVQVNVCGRG
jgi:hypothetical protein